MKIPIYEQTQTLEARGGSAFSLAGERARALTIPRGGAKWAGIVDFAESITRIGDRMRDAVRMEELSNAIVAANRQMADLSERIKTDPALINADVEQHEEYYTRETNRIRDEVVGSMDSAVAKNAFTTKFEEKTTAGKIRVRDLARNRIVSRGRASTDEQLDELIDNMIQTGDESTLIEGLSIIQGKVASGYFTAEEGRQLAEKFNRNAVLGYWDRKIFENPAMAWMVLKTNPSSLNNLQEADKTRLLYVAKREAEQQGKEDRRAAIYAELKGKYGEDWGKAIDWLEDPKHYPSLDLQSRRYLINTFEAERSRTLSERDRYRNEMARKHYGQVVELIKDKKYDEALIATEASDFIPPETKARIYNALSKGDSADVTDPRVYSTLIEGIHRGAVRIPDQIDQFRLNGLSNVDADKLVGKLGKPKYKEVLDYAEYRFKKDYPAKDDVEIHNRWFEFVNFIDVRLAEEERARGRTLTPDEGRKIVDSWLDTKIEERSFWFDKEYIPFFETTENTPESEIGQAERKTVEKIPRPVQDKISQILLKNGYAVTPRNIEIFYQNNREDFESVDQEKIDETLKNIQMLGGQ